MDAQLLPLLLPLLRVLLGCRLRFSSGAAAVGTLVVHVGVACLAGRRTSCPALPTRLPAPPPAWPQVVETGVSLAIIRLGVAKFEPLPAELFKYDFR